MKLNITFLCSLPNLVVKPSRVLKTCLFTVISVLSVSDKRQCCVIGILLVVLLILIILFIVLWIESLVGILFILNIKHDLMPYEKDILEHNNANVEVRQWEARGFNSGCTNTEGVINLWWLVHISSYWMLTCLMSNQAYRVSCPNRMLLINVLHCFVLLDWKTKNQNIVKLSWRKGDMKSCQNNTLSCFLVCVFLPCQHLKQWHKWATIG